MAVYICFGSQPGNLKSWLIRKLTKGPYSHTWIEYDSDTWAARMVVHAQSSGIVVESPDTVYEEYTLMKRYQCTFSGADEGLRKCYSYIGKPYDYKVILTNMLLMILYYMVPIKKFRAWLWTRTVTNSNAYSCSELGTLLLKNSGYMAAQGLDPELVTPTELENFCSIYPLDFLQEKG